VENSIAVALGGALGALSRYGLSNLIYQQLGRGFPWGTLVVNVAGSLIMGFLLIYLVEERFSLHETWRSLLVVGFLGALTTFSTFSADSILLLQQGEILKCMLNILVNVLICMLFVALGMLIAKQL